MGDIIEKYGVKKLSVGTPMVLTKMDKMYFHGIFDVYGLILADKRRYDFIVKKVGKGGYDDMARILKDIMADRYDKALVIKEGKYKFGLKDRLSLDDDYKAFGHLAHAEGYDKDVIYKFIHLNIMFGARAPEELKHFTKDIEYAVPLDKAWNFGHYLLYENPNYYDTVDDITSGEIDEFNRDLPDDRRKNIVAKIVNMYKDKAPEDMRILIAPKVI
ncbi:hypothetical protein GQ472_01535 [archaeon]|nr:hypothetical protein [archaeon]